MMHVFSRSPGGPYRARRAGTVLIAVFALVMLGAAAPSSVASAASAAKVTVANDSGDAVADTTYSTTLTVSGTGFQSVKGGFGGIYVAFGWVDSHWRPSEGGVSGKDYRYVPDSQQKDNAGFEKFVAFPKSQTAAAANGGTMTAAGKWKTTLVVPGPVVQVTGEDGSAVTIDCRKKKCGVLTFGAHGEKNAHNETFTPVTFTDLSSGKSSRDRASKSPSGTTHTPSSDSTPGAAGSATAAAGGASSTTAPDSAGDAGPGADERNGSDTDDSGTGKSTKKGDDTSAVQRTQPSVEVDRSSAAPGHVLAFSARGFQEGEQVSVVLDDGVAAVGPITVGLEGATAGVLTLPSDLSAGTHTLTVRGAASGASADVSFGARSASVATPAPHASDHQIALWAWLVVASGGLALAGVVVWRIVAARRARRTKPRSEASRNAAAGGPVTGGVA